MEIGAILKKLHPLERKVLPVLDKAASGSEVEASAGLSNVEVVRALQWLQNKGIVKLKEDVKEIVVLGANGRKYAKEGLPERMVLKASEKHKDIGKILEQSGIPKDELNICLGTLK